MTVLAHSFNNLLYTAAVLAKSTLRESKCQECSLSFLAKVVGGPFAPFQHSEYRY